MEDDEAGEEPQDFFIKQKIIHPLYSKKPSLDNDIALITLEEDVHFEDYRIQPICLPLSDPANAYKNKLIRTIHADRSYVGYHPHIAGWGAIGYRKESSPNLMEVQLEVRILILSAVSKPKDTYRFIFI